MALVARFGRRDARLETTLSRRSTTDSTIRMPPFIVLVYTRAFPRLMIRTRHHNCVPSKPLAASEFMKKEPQADIGTGPNCTGFSVS